MDIQDRYHDCSENVHKIFTDSGNIDPIISTFEELIPVSNNQDFPLGKLSRFFNSLQRLDNLSANLLSNTKSRIAQEQRSWLITVRKGIAITYCVIRSLFQSEQELDELLISYYFVSYDLRQSIQIIIGYVELLVLKAEEPLQNLDENLPSFSESSLEMLSERLSDVIPGNEFSQQYKKSKESFNESDLAILLEMKQSCKELNTHLNTVRKLFTDFDSKVSLY